ncbi:uncharacterized protein I206_105841 [Kwoniella pini CBS 10737]|uniref:Uncharacterized protein n=1 Tax=Kwoniella pini CBS 10737 TaxID=1296096 RepID=A0A1B9I0D7_9TREE|nr:uncharacterized protein I206_04661 [Kwoniella pini CBS 10737]OCF48974.1 hypothetical protein I206_04661 [Kwoniella pini CBS 10737]
MLLFLLTLSYLFLLSSTIAAPSSKFNIVSHSNSENLIKRQANVQFNSTWPNQFVGGESISMSWIGSNSGKYSVAWIEDYNKGDDLLNTFKVCWSPDSTSRFIVWDGEGLPLPEQRAYGPKLPLIEGDNEPSTC